MTLVVSISTPSYGIQVGDRLVSKAETPYDTLANKSLIVRCDDGLLALSYSGLAFMDGVPTDEWLARVIAQAEVADGMMIGGRFRIGDTGSTLRRIAEALNSSPFVKYAGGLSAAGWQWKSNRKRSLLRNVLWGTVRDGNNLVWRQQVPRARDDRKDSIHLQWIGTAPLGSSRFREIIEVAARARRDWTATESAIVKLIRDSSAARPGIIGPHCATAVVRQWSSPQAEILFRPAEAHFATRGDERVQVAYTPWIIASDYIHAPSLSIGGLTTQGGLLDFAIGELGTAPGQQLLGLLDRQARRAA